MLQRALQQPDPTCRSHSTTLSAEVLTSCSASFLLDRDLMELQGAAAGQLRTCCSLQAAWRRACGGTAQAARGIGSLLHASTEAALSTRGCSVQGLAYLRCPGRLALRVLV